MNLVGFNTGMVVWGRAGQGAYSGVSDFSCRAGTEDTEESELHADVDNVIASGDLNVLGDDAEGDDFVAAPEATEGDEIAREEGGHDQWVGGAAKGDSQNAELTTMLRIAYKIPGRPVGRLLNGHKGSEPLRGIHIGNPENAVMLGL